MSSNSYDNPRVQSISFTHDFSAGDTLDIPVPDGMGRCRIDDIIAMGSVVIVGATADVEIGDGVDPNKYAELALGTLAAGSSLSLDDTGKFDVGQGGKGVVDIATENITDLVLTLTAATSGSVHLTIVISWW